MYAAEDLYIEDQDDLEIIQEPENTENLEAQEEDANENEQQNEENNGEEAAPDTTATKAKRVVRNPQPKLNAETLKSSKGLQALPPLFEKIKFKGKGHEEEDLNILIKTYEYWCHRLFPKLPLDDCLAKIETLGHKKPVQTYLKKIRMDIMEEDAPQVQSEEENETVNDTPNDPFDEVLPPARNIVDDPVVLTNAQLEQIRLNRERALKLRMERLQAIKNTATTHLPITQQDTDKNFPEAVERNEGPIRDISDSGERLDLSVNDVEEETNINDKHPEDRMIPSLEDSENEVRHISKHKKTVLDSSDSEVEQDLHVSDTVEKRKSKHGKHRIIESSEDEAEVAEKGIETGTFNAKENQIVVTSEDIDCDLSDSDLKENSTEHAVYSEVSQDIIPECQQENVNPRRPITDATDIQPIIQEEMDIDCMLDQIEADI